MITGIVASLTVILAFVVVGLFVAARLIEQSRRDYERQVAAIKKWSELSLDARWCIDSETGKRYLIDRKTNKIVSEGWL